MDAVYDHEPRIQATGPVWLTVVVSAVSPVEVTMQVRVYVHAADDPEGAESHLLEVVGAVDDALGASSDYGPSQWTLGPIDGIAALVATCECARGQ